MIRGVRWLPVLLLAACASTPEWNLDPVSDATRPAVLRELRNPLGDATVVVGDRAYFVPSRGHPGYGVEPEIRAFAAAVADAVESQGPPEPHAPPPSGGGIVALPWTGEALTMTTLGIEQVRTDRGTVIYAWGLLEPNSWIVAEVRGTEATAAAWERLAAAVRERSTATWICGPTFLAMGRGFDLRSIGGPGLRE